MVTLIVRKRGKYHDMLLYQSERGEETPMESHVQSIYSYR